MHYLFRLHSSSLSKACWASLLGAALLSTPQAFADDLTAVPATWRLQDYQDGAVVIFNAGSSCSSGKLELLASAPAASKDRLWSIVMTGKAANLPVGVFYHTANGQCLIDSFYM